MPDFVKKPHKPQRIPRLFASSGTACHPLTDAFGSFDRGVFRIDEYKKLPQADACGNFL